MYFLFHEPEEILEEFTIALKNSIQRLKSRIKCLEEENKKLKDEAYKDKELARMKEERDTAIKNADRGFPIYEREQKAINTWIEKHDAEVHHAKSLKERLRLEGVSGGRHKYIFVPTAIGTVGKIQCSCGETFIFRDL